MKKVTDVIAAIISCIGIFTLASFLDNESQTFISLFVYITLFFLSGLIIRKFYNNKHLVLSFSIILFSLEVFVFLIGDFPGRIAMSIIAMSLSYIMGYMWLKWRISLKIASCLILMIFYFSSVFYFMPQIINRNLFFKHNNLKNNSALNYFNNVELKDTLGNTYQDVFKKNKVYLIEFYFRNCWPCVIKEDALEKLREEIPDSSFQIIYIQNGKIDDFESYLETCREKKNSTIRYYDNNGILSSNLKLKGYPFGMVIDKAGKIRQTENGFGPEVADLFLDKEIPLIKVLLNEN